MCLIIPIADVSVYRDSLYGSEAHLLLPRPGQGSRASLLPGSEPAVPHFLDDQKSQARCVGPRGAEAPKKADHWGQGKREGGREGWRRRMGYSEKAGRWTAQHHEGKDRVLFILLLDQVKNLAHCVIDGHTYGIIQYLAQMSPLPRSFP